MLRYTTHSFMLTLVNRQRRFPPPDLRSDAINRGSFGICFAYLFGALKIGSVQLRPLQIVHFSLTPAKQRLFGYSTVSPGLHSTPNFGMQPPARRPAERCFLSIRLPQLLRCAFHEATSSCGRGRAGRTGKASSSRTQSTSCTWTTDSPSRASRRCELSGLPAQPRFFPLTEISATFRILPSSRRVHAYVKR